MYDLKHFLLATPNTIWGFHIVPRTPLTAIVIRINLKEINTNVGRNLNLFTSRLLLLKPDIEGTTEIN